MSGYGGADNYAGNIIATLAGLPEFLRKPILRRRMSEFPVLPADEQDEIVGHALEASPEIPFPVFAKLFGTWLDVLAGMGEAERGALLGAYARGIAAAPGRVAALHMDGLVAVFAHMETAGREALSSSTRRILRGMDPESRRRILLMTPDAAKDMLGI